MKYTTFLMISILLFVLSSCSDTSEGLVLTEPALHCKKGFDYSDHLSVESVSKPTLVEGNLSIERCISVSAKIKVIKKIEVLSPIAASIDLCDENENSLITAYAGDDIETLINAEPGKIITIKGKSESIDKSTAEDYIKRIKKACVNTENSVSESNVNEEKAVISSPIMIDLAGSVSKYPIVMHLNIDGKNVEGQYYYTSSGANYPLKLSGTANSEGYLDIHETNEEGQPTGHFTGIWDGNEYSGEFVNYKGQHFNFKLTKQDGSYTAVNISDNGDGSRAFVSEEYTNPKSTDVPDIDMSGENWDEFLDAYERYVNKLIPYLRKCTNGDMSALADYPKMMKEAERFSDKIQNANTKGFMSSSQWQRYLKIQNKLMEEYTRMQNHTEKAYDY